MVAAASKGISVYHQQELQLMSEMSRSSHKRFAGDVGCVHRCGQWHRLQLPVIAVEVVVSNHPRLGKRFGRSKHIIDVLPAPCRALQRSGRILGVVATIAVAAMTE